jgi:hypothetical protein
LQQEQLWQPLELEAVKEFFHQTAGEDMEVSWEELKEILDFITEYGKITKVTEYYDFTDEIFRHRHILIQYMQHTVVSLYTTWMLANICSL